MADLQISNLPALAEAGIQSTDVLALADLSATETKKVTVKDLVAAAAQFLDAGDIPAAKVGSGISAGSLADGSVTNVKLANDSVSFGGVSVDLGAADATPAFNLSDATAYPTSALVGTITNAQLAGSIANAKLTNSSVSLGGITVALGASDATPAFDLTDATSYKTTNLVGTITNAQLAGSIAVAKLVSSSVNFGGVTVALGASDTTPAFDLSDATNYPTSALVGTITNAQLAGSIANTKLVANSITANELAANSVTDSELANLSVDTGAVQDAAITNDKVQTSTNSSTGLDGATKIRDATITPAKLNTSNLDRSLNVASGNLGINNAVTAATRSGITYNAQGLITATAALVAGDLPLATTSAVGGVSIASAGGLAITGAGALSIAATVTGATATKVTFNGFGQITGTGTLTASDLPLATASAVGGVSIPTGGPLAIDGNGAVTVADSGVTAGTNTKVTVDAKGRVTALAALADSDLPNHSAALLTSGSIAAARIGVDTIDGTKLSNTSTAIFQSIAQDGYPTAQFSGQILFDTVSEDAFIWDGNAWQAITTLTKGSLVFGGTFNANTSQMVAATSAGIAAGLAVGSNLPTASATTDGVYVVVSTSGTPASPAPAIAFAPPDYILGVTNSAGSSWNEVDLSQTVAGQVASNITFTPYGQISATNVQDGMQELETEKLALAGGTVTGQVLIGNTGSLVFEGSTVDAYETTLTVADPTTSDKTITLPNVTGTVITTGDAGTVTGTMLANDTIQNVDIKSDAAIAFTKLADLTSAQILVGNGSNKATSVAVTGDIAITNAGVTSIAAGVIVNADISGSAAITGSKVTTGTTSAVGVLQLTDSATSTSATTAATPAAVKIAKDAADAAATTANAALPTTGGTLTGNLILDNAKELRLSEADGDGANYTGLKAQAQSGDITLTLPAVAPTAGQVLKANASTPTTLEWGSDSATDATKMPLAGGTFTGDVTFTGDSSNGLWDKSASAFVANLTGNASGSAATVTGAAQSAITSLGTLTGLTVAGNYAQTLTSNGGFTATSAGDNAIQIIGDSNRSANENTLLSLHGKWNGTNVAMIDIQAGDDTTNKDNGQIVFYTAAAGSTAEALRIHEDKSATFAGDVKTTGLLTVENDLPKIKLIDSDATGTPEAMLDGSGGDLYLEVDKDDEKGSSRFGVKIDGSEKMRIDSSGRLLLGTTTEGEGSADNLTIADSGSCGITIRSGTSNAGAIYFSDGTSGADEYKGYVQYSHNNEALYIASGGATALTINSSQNATFAGTVSDSKGNLRSIPQNTQGSAYVLATSDAGKHILASGDITVTPASGSFAAGDAVTIINNTAGDIGIISGGTVGVYNSADGSTTTPKTLATRGMATLIFVNSSTAYISGAGLS